MHNDDILDEIWPKILNTELRDFVMALKVDQTRNPRYYKKILQAIATEVPKLAMTGSYRRDVSEVQSDVGVSKDYTREGDCPDNGVMSDGKIVIGNYTGRK